MRTSYTFFLFFLTVLTGSAYAQEYQRCGTSLLLETNFLKDPSYRLQIAASEERLQGRILQNAIQLKSNVNAEIVIPVVVHIVMANPNQVTDAQVNEQLKMLNDAFSGINADTSKIPSYFQGLTGRSRLRFCLAQRTPAQEATSGIVRYATTTSAFSVESERIKHSTTGGANAWNTDDYFNIWIGSLSNNILGYSSFPGIGAGNEQGVVIHYASLPGGSILNYNKGKTLVHETGHFFFLYHIWGDDDGGCSGSDQVDDTPNQSNATTGCPGSVVTDNCSRNTPGVMFQNYMDYSYDDCLAMFTSQQVARMEAAFTNYHASLLESEGCLPLAAYTRNIEMKSILSPAQRICTASLAPAFSFRNMGRENLSSMLIHVAIDNEVVANIPWTGSVPSLGTTTVALPALPSSPGDHLLTIYTSTPNGASDEYTSDDTLRFAFMYYPSISTPLTERFEDARFPPKAWDIVNKDGLNTWERSATTTAVSNSAVSINNFQNTKTGEKDFLRLPELRLPLADSAYMTFQLAAAPGSATGITDTLEILLSTDCGVSYSSLYKKWGNSLATRTSAVNSAFVPAANEWRKDSITLTPYLGKDQIMLAFVNTNGHKNNIYLDDIAVYTKNVNPFLKETGFLMSPNPVASQVTIQFYPTAADLQQIAIYTPTGQLVAIQQAGKNPVNLYQFDMSRVTPGMYIVKATFKDRTITRKLMKVH